jgi:hypothetical protein
MERTFQVLNELEAAGLVLRYAIGGAMGLMFYTEPFITFDLDVFVFVPNSDSPVITLAPIYDYLRERGCEERREHVMIGGTPVQFIAAYNPLIEEAVREAVDEAFKGVRVRVARLEHLLAIMLQTGRAKDHARLAQVLGGVSVDETAFAAIRSRHQLEGVWQQFRQRFA